MNDAARKGLALKGGAVRRGAEHRHREGRPARRRTPATLRLRKTGEKP
jgi:hypothetical protein